MSLEKRERLLSKSRIINSYQCDKLLYLSVCQPELLTITEGRQAIFDQGTAVGLEAQKRFPNGILIEAKAYEAEKAFVATKKAIESGANTIYEATFIYDNVQARIDILHRETNNSDWKIIEVKSSTSLKDVYLKDIAIQTWVAEGAGIKIGKSMLMHINNECTYPDLSNLFTIIDVTKDVLDYKNEIPEKASKARAILSLDNPPSIDIGPHCSDPYECALKNHCWKHIPENNIFNLPRIGKKGWELYKEGIIELSDKRILDVKLNEAQKRVVKVAQSGVRFVNKDAIKNELSNWIYPLSYLDFETVAFAIPIYDGTRPYQQIPFQFSVQVENEDSLTSSDYLHDDNSDPRPQLIEALIDAVPKGGSVVSFNKAFEASRMKEMANSFPEFRRALVSIIERLVDPLPIFRSSVYDSGFKGSFSIKKVAPSLIGDKYSYKDLSISDGGAASRGFIQLISEKMLDEDRRKLRSDMIKYCDQDTMCMVGLVSWMRSQVS